MEGSAGFVYRCKGLFRLTVLGLLRGLPFRNACLRPRGPSEEDAEVEALLAQ